MKLILSRKGFDSSCGEQASPIMPDGTLLSLPIPDDEDNAGEKERLDSRRDACRDGEALRRRSRPELSADTGRALRLERLRTQVGVVQLAVLPRQHDP